MTVSVSRHIAASLLVLLSGHFSQAEPACGPDDARSWCSGDGGSALLQKAVDSSRSTISRDDEFDDSAPNHDQEDTRRVKGEKGKIYDLHVSGRSKTLTGALERPLYDVKPLDARISALAVEPAEDARTLSEDPLTMLVYHKTGTVFSEELIGKLNVGLWKKKASYKAGRPCGRHADICDNVALMRNTSDHEYYVTNSNGEKRFLGVSQQSSMGKVDYNEKVPGLRGGNHHIHPNTKLFFAVKPSIEFEPPKSSKTVHWLREPVDLIASAYRYLSEGREHWMFNQRHCNYCYQDSLQILADTCGHHEERCTFHNLVHSVNETEGVLYVAMNLQRQMQNMFDNLHRWADDPKVLHLSVHALGKDFDGTAKCMLRFAGIDKKRQATLLPMIQTLDINRDKDHNSGHVTHGKYDNTAIKEFLTSQPVWGKQFEEFRKAMETVSLRQQKMYGCPAIL